jgi:hypothetical protein
MDGPGILVDLVKENAVFNGQMIAGIKSEGTLKNLDDLSEYTGKFDK